MAGLRRGRRSAQSLDVACGAAQAGKQRHPDRCFWNWRGQPVSRRQGIWPDPTDPHQIYVSVGCNRFHKHLKTRSKSRLPQTGTSPPTIPNHVPACEPQLVVQSTPNRIRTVRLRKGPAGKTCFTAADLQNTSNLCVYRGKRNVCRVSKRSQIAAKQECALELSPERHHLTARPDI